MYAALKSIASYIPTKCVSNHDFEKILDTSDEWIIERTGISTRYFALDGEDTSDLGAKAGALAIERAGLKPSDIDLILVGTLSPDFLGMPSTACLVARKLGLSNCPAFDITAACTGFIYLLATAKAFVESGIYKKVLIIGAEKISKILDFSDRSTCVLFGDGAGAAVISTTDDPKKSILDVHISGDGNFSSLLQTPISSLKNDAKQCLQMRGNEVFKIAVKTLVTDVENIMQKNNITSKDVTYFIPHQANLRIIKAVGERLSFQKEQIILSVQKYGNTSAASIPMAMNDVYESGKLKNGDLMVLDAIGGGLTWGSALVYFDGN